MQVKNQILDLRKQGLSYNKIQEILRCSKSTISFHCGHKQKEKKNNRQNRRRSDNCLIKKIETFRNRKYKDANYSLKNRISKKLIVDLCVPRATLGILNSIYSAFVEKKPSVQGHLFLLHEKALQEETMQ